MLFLKRIHLFILIMPLAVAARGDEIHSLTSKFSNGEIGRSDYLDRLFEIRAGYVESVGKGSTVTDRKIAEIDQQMKRHPLAASAGGKVLSGLRVGIWQASRHTNLFRADHTWIMLPIVSGYDPQGVWNIKGNHYYESAPRYGPEKVEGEIILLDARYFVCRTGNQLFYEKKLKEYHGQ